MQRKSLQKLLCKWNRYNTHEIFDCEDSVDHNSPDTRFNSCEIVEYLRTKYYEKDDMDRLHEYY